LRTSRTCPGSQRLGHSGEAAQVAEEHGHLQPLATGRRLDAVLVQELGDHSGRHVLAEQGLHPAALAEFAGAPQQHGHQHGREHGADRPDHVHGPSALHAEPGQAQIAPGGDDRRTGREPQRQDRGRRPDNGGEAEDPGQRLGHRDRPDPGVGQHRVGRTGVHQHGRQLADRGPVQLGERRVGQAHHHRPAPDALGRHAPLEDVEGGHDVGAARGEPGRPADPKGAGPVGGDAPAAGDHDAVAALGRLHRP
jgi:hypothetical protein